MSGVIRVVVVDDDVPTRVGLNTILSAEPDIEVVGEGANGLEACELVEALKPDIVLMDVQLPELDGIEATRRIIDMHRGDESPPRVIVLTTYDLDEYAYRSLRVGASGFLLKRTRAEELVEAVRVVAEGEALPLPTNTRRLIAYLAGTVPVDSGDWSAINSLTEREGQVLALLARGMSNIEIAADLGLSIDTVKTHLKHIYAKLGARGRAQAVIAAYESGVVARRGDER